MHTIAEQIYISGHGGNEFMKFQDVEDLMAQDVADAIWQMHEKNRYKEILLLVETCQAATLASKIEAPNVLTMASSLKGACVTVLSELDIVFLPHLTCKSIFVKRLCYI